MKRQTFNRQNVNQEQPLLLEELLEQEKREQERDTGEWSAPAAAAPPAPGVPLYGGVAPAPPPPPPERVLSDADRRAHLLYHNWLQQNSAFVTDQLRYYEAEVQKLRKIRKVSP